MDKRLLAIIIGIFVIIVGLGYLYQTVPTPSEIVDVTMQNNNGDNIGTIKLSETRAGVLVNLELNGLDANGEHAIHIHENGDCSPQKTFKNAGGHFNPADSAHGLKHPEGHHAGDMPNLKPNASGAITVVLMNTKVTLLPNTTPDGRSTVFDENGSAIIIHAGADDHMSQPSGAAGDRIACGVIQK